MAGFLGIDSLFGGGKTKATSDTNTNSTRNATQTTNQTSKSSTNTKQSQTGRTIALDDETLAAVTSAVKALSGDIGSDFDINKVIAAQKEEATRQYNEQDLAQINQLAQQTGSIDNSFVQELKSKGQQDLQTRLAALGMNTLLQSRYNAADALSRTGVVAKGADTSTTVDTTGKSDTEATLDAVSKLIETLTSNTTETQKSEKGNSLINLFSQ